MPGHPNYWRQLAAVYGQLGRQEEANAAIARLLELEPDFVANAWEELFKGIHVVKFVEHFIEGLRKAGLDIPSDIRTRQRLSQPAPAG